MWEFIVTGGPALGVSAIIVVVDRWLGAEAVKRRVLLAVFRDEPTIEVVRQGKVVREASYSHGEERLNPWSNRKLAALLVCITEGLVEEKAGRYVLTEMGRLSFSRPAKKKGERYG